MIFKIFSTSFSDSYDDASELFHDYHGVVDVPYLSTGVSVGMGSGINYLIVAIDDNNDTIMGGVILYVGDTESLNGTGATAWMSSIGVSEPYQGKGLSRFLVNEFFEFCELINVGKVEQSSYTEQGKDKVKHIFDEVTDFYPTVEYLDVLNVDNNSSYIIVEE